MLVTCVGSLDLARSPLNLYNNFFKRLCCYSRIEFSPKAAVMVQCAMDSTDDAELVHRQAALLAAQLTLRLGTGAVLLKRLKQVG